MNSEVELIANLLRIARGLEADAHYLRARPFRAAALSVGAQASRSNLRVGAGLEPVAEAVITDLEGKGMQPALVAMLREVVQGLADGNSPPSGETSISVCVRCGEVSFGETMAPCAACGAGPLAARSIFAAPFYDPAPSDQVLAGLEITPRLLNQMCEGLNETSALGGTWPVRDILDHLLGAQRLIWGRAQRMLNEDEPDLGGGVPPPRASDDAKGRLSVGELVTAFAYERSELLERVRGLADEEWERGGTAANWGRTTVRQRMTYLARHEHDHLGDLAESLAEAGIPAPR